MPKIGDIMNGSVVKILPVGALVQVSENQTGLLHISQVSKSYVTNVSDFLKVGDSITVRVININHSENKTYLSIPLVDDEAFEAYKTDRQKKETKGPSSKPSSNSSFKPRPKPQRNKPIKPKDEDPATVFEQRMSRFLKDSKEKLQDLQRNREKKQGGRKKPRFK